MAKTKKPKEAVVPSEEMIAQAIHEGQDLITEGKTKVEAAMAICRALPDCSQEVVLQAFIEGASLTPKGALTYWYNCRRKFSQERSE